MVSNVEEILKKHGWYVSSEKLDEVLSKDGNVNNNNVDDLIKTLLDLDLNSVGVQFKSESNNGAKQKAELVSGPLVLQIQKVRNVSAPKANENSHTAPQLLKVTATDGSATYQILQIGSWNTVSLETPPGTKLQIKSGQTCRVSCGFLPLKQKQFSLIGGSVAGLLEKWQMTKFGLSNRPRDCRAPKWVPFGQKISNPDMKGTSGNFKSLESEAKQAKENEAFDQQRLANIEEITKTLEIKKKSFVKSKPPVECPPEKFRGNQRRQDYQPSGGSQKPGRGDSGSEPNRPRHERRPQGRRDESEDASSLAPPSKCTTLFDFLTNKLSEGEGPKDPTLTAVAKSSLQYDYSQSRGRDKEEDRSNRRNVPTFSNYNNSRSDNYGGRHNDSSHNYRQNQQEGQRFQNKFGEYHSQASFQMEDKVLAKYWEDQKMHRAVITALGETGRTCVIRFVDYDNYEEVLLSDVQPCAPHKWDNFRPGGPPRNQRRPDYQQQQQQQQQGQGEGQRHPYGRTGGYQQGGRNEGRRGDPEHHHRGGQGRPEPGPPPSGGGGGRAFDEGGNLNQHFSGTFEFRRGGNKPYVQSNRGGHQSGDQQGGRGGQHSRPPPQGARPERQYYQPPRQRKE